MTDISQQKDNLTTDNLLILSGKALILKSATRLFADKGFRGISMREIAESSHMTKAALYYHFQNKDDLLKEIFMVYLQESESRLQMIINHPVSASQRIKDLVLSIMDETPDNLGIIHLIFAESPHLSEEFRQEIGEKYHQLFLGSLEGLFLQAIEANEIRSINPTLAAQTLFGMMYLHFHPQHQHNPQQMKTAAEFILEIFFKGVKKENLLE